MHKWLPAITAIVVLTTVGPVLPAATVTLTGVFTGGQEVPSNATPGTGNVTVIVDDVLDTAQVNLTFSGMQNASIGAGLYCCASPIAINVAPLVANFTPWTVGKSGSYSNTFSITAPTAAGLEAGQGYVNIRSDGFVNGEIRANLSTAPEPASFALIGVGLTGLALIKRRKR